MEEGLKPYDFLPLVPIIEGAGGVITDWHGKPLNGRSDGRVVAAAGRALWTETLKVLG
ncbi:inositol monophosphatase family protein [Cupriavidus sp. UYPR2.512]|uniref:inositol monophosphatase family protein n=1 Tax=Cupriavidus sp. UYPR2.512 TaxID=1080187 RepID=UPI00350FD981